MSAQRDLNENKGYDDLDELDYEDGRYGSSRFMRMLSIGFVVAAVGGFCTLAWYAYKSGQEPVNESDIPVVEADMSPVKEKPENPGGWQFQHQDKSVYNQLAAGEGTAPEPVAERVVPKPEEPVTLEKTASNNAAANKNQNVAQEFKKEPIGNLAPASGAVKIEAPKPEKEAQTATLTPVPSIASEEVSEPEVSVKSKPKELKPVEPSKPKVKQEVKTQELKAEAPKKVAAKKATGGKYMVQLGAFRSETDANAAWNKLQSNHGVLAGQGHNVQKADLGTKGVMYRLRVGPFADDSAVRDVCAKLKSKSQACFPVRL